ncbi:hypothetical protein CPB86DRAFT_389260 [Serendipita vermifera]|nr:hypothetical protein CPB86DRAFT_389260 [Serendipita vermifera]
MYHGNRAGPSQSRQSTNTTGRPGTPASMTPRERKKKRLDDAVNNAITIAKIAKDTGETIPLLAPLKASMGIVITLLEIVKDVRKCEEDWETLSNYLATRIKLLQDHLANKPANVESQELITEYKE